MDAPLLSRADLAQIETVLASSEGTLPLPPVAEANHGNVAATEPAPAPLPAADARATLEDAWVAIKRVALAASDPAWPGERQARVRRALDATADSLRKLGRALDGGR